MEASKENSPGDLFLPGQHATSSTDELHPSLIADFPGSFVRPDADHTWRKPWKGFLEYFRVGWTDVRIWKSAFIEMVATILLCYISGILDDTVSNFQTRVVAPFVGVTNIFLLSLFIMAAGPSLGGHINPTISFAVTAAGLMSLPKGILYMLGQLLGGAVAGGLLRGSLGRSKTSAFQGGGCFIFPNTVSVGQAFLIETISSFALLFLAFGVGLDPRQKTLFGPSFGPIAVGCCLGLVSFASAGLQSGYTGASMNPSRCFAFAVARGDFSDHWIWWVGPAAGGILHTIVYLAVPPYQKAPPRD